MFLVKNIMREKGMHARPVRKLFKQVAANSVSGFYITEELDKFVWMPNLASFVKRPPIDLRTTTTTAPSPTSQPMERSNAQDSTVVNTRSSAASLTVEAHPIDWGISSRFGNLSRLLHNP
jgi:hypothetical protein